MYQSLTFFSERQLPVSHEADGGDKETGEAEDNEHPRGNLGVDLAVRHARNGKADDDKRNTHETKIRNHIDECLSIGFNAATGEIENRVHGTDNTDNQGAVAYGPHICNARHKDMGRLQVEDAEYEKQPASKGILEDCRLKDGANDYKGAHNSGNETGTFGLTHAQEQQADRDPHHANQK
jgi:hypothetical protein